VQVYWSQSSLKVEVLPPRGRDRIDGLQENGQRRPTAGSPSDEDESLRLPSTALSDGYIFRAVKMA